MRQKTRATIRAAAAQGLEAVLHLMRGPDSYMVRNIHSQANSPKLTPQEKAILLEAAAIVEQERKSNLGGLGLKS